MSAGSQLLGRFRYTHTSKWYRIAAIIHLIVRYMVANMIFFDYNRSETDDNSNKLTFTRVHLNIPNYIRS